MKWQIINKAQEYKIKVNNNEAIGVVMPINKGGQYRVIVDLLGQGARALILGIIIGKGKDMIDLTTETRHVVGNTHAETMIHG